MGIRHGGIVYEESDIIELLSIIRRLRKKRHVPNLSSYTLKEIEVYLYKQIGNSIIRSLLVLLDDKLKSISKAMQE